MVTNTIVDVLAAANLGLTKGTNLFSERSTGNKYVLVSSIAPNGDDYLPTVRYGHINILVVGWGIKEGSVLAEKIASKLLTMEGNAYTYNNGTNTETYKMMSITIRNWPSLIPNLDIVAFTTNAELSYKQTNS